MFRTGDLASGSEVAFSVAGSGSNPVDSADFGGAWPSGIVAFAPGESAKVISVQVAGDTQIEADEELTVSLRDATGATIGIGDASATVVNDDHPATVSISAGDAIKPEGNGDSSAFLFNLTRTGDLSASSTVFYQVEGIGDNPASADDFGSVFPTGCK